MDDIGELETSRAGAALARLTAAPALLLVCWLGVGLPLLMAGVFRPWAVIPLFAVAAALVLTYGLRALRPPAGPVRSATSWLPLVGLLAVAVAFAAFQMAMSSEQIVVRRDPASYFNFANWLTGHGSLPIPQMRWAFGGADPALSYESPAFFQRGGVLVPQFMAGMPMIASAGGWLGGGYGLLAVPAVVGALGLVSFGGLTARLIGPKWAPLGALALGLTWPMMMISRSIYSETGALVLTLGGLSLAIDAVRANRRLPALLGGLALGLTVLVRIDAPRDVLPVVVFAGILLGLRRRTGAALAAGLAAGCGAGLLEGYVMSRPYLQLQRDSLYPLLYISVAVIVATVAVSLWIRRRGLPDSSRLGLPGLALPATFAVMALLATRPLWQVVREPPKSSDDLSTTTFITLLQQAQRLPVDPDRRYTELTLNWVAWYIGIPAVLLATLGAGLVLRRLLLRRDVGWWLPYAVIVWTTVTTLLRPAITPDQPWASRRLAVVVIPGMLLFALWAMAWAVHRAQRLGFHPGAGRFTAALGAVFVLTPALITSGFHVQGGGSPAIEPAMMFVPTEQGEVGQARSMCRAIGHKASVLFVERVTADRFAQIIRGMCGTPAGRVKVVPGTDNASPGDVARLVAKVRAAGRRPVLLGAAPRDVSAYGRAGHVFHVDTRRESSDLVSAPHGTWTLTMDVWMAVPMDTG